MNQLFVLGTGNAAVTKCYNTCFALYNGEEYFLVDAGGGNGILSRFEDMDIDISRIHHVFITHEHTDHILGVIWVIRMIGTKILKDSYRGNLNIYCHPGLSDTILTLCSLTLQNKFVQLIGKRILLIPVEDGESRVILNYPVTFFDIHSSKAKQFGFTALLQDGKRLTCTGDEPFHPSCRPYLKGCSWLLHEAFCLFSHRDIFSPYEKHHSTVKEACILAESMGIEHLVLWHTEDKNLSRRKQLYTEEGQIYYHGNLHVPDDKEILDL